ncbi:MAG: serine/threonine protein kinase [Myxococcota bacterium]|nr:serine/threonine protein kinase [Myxococcota bacterium]
MEQDSPPETRDELVGTVLDRRYRIERCIGSGGTGVVYAAWHLNLERPVAIKMLHRAFLDRPEQVEQFRLEAQVMGMIGHDCVVSVLDFRYSSEGIPYIVMELLRGEPLSARLRRGPLEMVEVAALFPPLCEALAQAHDRGIVHGDLKPDNLMLEPREEGEILKMLDFGTAWLTSGLKAKPALSGTLHYLAPERLESDIAVPDQRADIFALGAILYECLSGQLAFPGDTPAAVAYNILNDLVPSLRLPDGRPAKALDAVIRRACHRDPQQRYGTALELSAALTEAVELTNRASPSSFSSAISRPHIVSRPPSLPLRPMGPRLFSDSKPTGAGVKPVVPLAALQQVASVVGMEPVLQRLGPDWLAGLQSLAMTDWVDGVELQRVMACAHDMLGGEPALRKLGQTFAALALTTTYRALLAEGEPEHVVRRAQVMMRLWYSEGESKSREIAPGRWQLIISGLRCMDAHVAAGTAGFIEGYLSLAGARDYAVQYECKDEQRPIWEFMVSFSCANAT